MRLLLSSLRFPQGQRRRNSSETSLRLPSRRRFGTSLGYRRKKKRGLLSWKSPCKTCRLTTPTNLLPSSISAPVACAGLASISEHWRMLCLMRSLRPCSMLERKAAAKARKRSVCARRRSHRACFPAPAANSGRQCGSRHGFFPNNRRIRRKLFRSRRTDRSASSVSKTSTTPPRTGSDSLRNSSPRPRKGNCARFGMNSLAGATPLLLSRRPRTRLRRR